MLREADSLLFVTSNISRPVKNTSGSSAAVFCACEIIQLFSVVFYAVSAKHKFDFRLVMNEAPDTWRPVKWKSCSAGDSCF